MLELIILLASGVLVLEANEAPVVCGYLPTKLYSCIGAPQFVKPDLASQCVNSATECERLTCIFNKAGWLKDNKLNKQKLLKHFDDYAKEHPEWLPAVEQAKTTCINADLPPQGVHLNCPAYDVTECSLAAFIKHAQPSQWSSSPECRSPQQFAAACPICPTDCFSPQIPIGSCNACLSLPRSP